MISALETHGDAMPAREVHPACLGRPAVDFFIDDETEFAQAVPAKGGQRQKVRRILAVLADLHHRWPNICDGCRFHARQLARNGTRGWSFTRLRTLYYQFTTGGKKVGGVTLFQPGDWRMLCRLNRAEVKGIAQRHELIALFQQRCDAHQRALMPAFRDLACLYTTGFTTDGQRVKGVEFERTFPGYAEWPAANPHTGLPEAWSYERFTRYAPDDFERNAARTGIKKASGEGLKARFSRVGVKPYQLVSGDDEQPDVKCLVPGQTGPRRPRGLGIHDYATDAVVEYVMKSPRWDADEQKLKVLNNRDTMWFVIGFLMRTGYRADTGTTFLVELGGFAVPGDNRDPERPISDPDRMDLRARIWRATAGKVTFANSAGFAKAAHGGQGAGPVGGNPRFKPIEGAWARLRNRVDALPGQVGKDRLHCPEQSGRETADAVQLLKSIGLLPTERAENLQLTLLTFAELAAQVYQAVADLNADPRHTIKQWEKCGFIVKEYFDATSNAWFPLTGLPERVAQLAGDHARSLAESLRDNPAFIRARRMTRAEALATGREGLKRIPLSAMLDLVGREHAINKGEPKAVVAGEFTFDVAEIDPDPIAYKAVDAEGRPLREGARYLCLVNPMFPDACVIYDAQERFVSVCPRRVDAPRTEHHAVMQMVGEVQQWRNAKLAPMRARHGEDAERLAFIRAHNAAVTGDRIKPDRIRTEPQAEVPVVDTAALIRQRAQAREDLPEEQVVPWE